MTAIHNGCIGGGVDLVSATDIRYCTDDAWFQLKETEIGLLYFGILFYNNIIIITTLCFLIAWLFFCFIRVYQQFKILKFSQIEYFVILLYLFK